MIGGRRSNVAIFLARLIRDATLILPSALGSLDLGSRVDLIFFDDRELGLTSCVLTAVSMGGATIPPTTGRLIDGFNSPIPVPP